MKKLAIVVSHPIQYHSPLFREVARHFDVKVYYCFNPNSKQIGESGFGIEFKWDIDLLSGYDCEFLKNISKAPSTIDFYGCDTPDIGEVIHSNGATHVIIFGWYLKSYRQALNHCRKYKIPVAVRGDSQLDPYLPYWKRVIKNIYYPYFLSKYDAFLFVGERNKQYLQNYRVPEKKLIYSPHAVDQQFWKTEPLAHKLLTFIWVAKFIEKKRPMDVISAFINLKKIVPDVRLKMVGTGPLFAECKSLASDHPEIEFTGFKNQTELLDEFSEADALILSSDFGETWGLVVNEAFSIGIPAIVSDSCGCSPDMIDEYSGITYEMGNIDALIQAMLEMSKRLKDPETRKKISQSIQTKNEIHSFASNVKAFQKFLEF